MKTTGSEEWRRRLYLWTAIGGLAVGGLLTAGMLESGRWRHSFFAVPIVAGVAGSLWLLIHARAGRR